MIKNIMLVPSGINVGLSQVALGFVESISQNNHKVSYLDISDLGLDNIESLISNNQIDTILDNVVSNYFEKVSPDTEIVIVDGITYNHTRPYVAELNKKIAVALSAKIILVTTLPFDLTYDLENELKLTMRYFSENKILGCFINKIPLMGCIGGCAGCQRQDNPLAILGHFELFQSGKIQLLAGIPSLNDCNKDEIAKYINTSWLTSFLQTTEETALTPPLFRYNLVKRAKSSLKKILLPEGNDIRTIKAANICAEKGIAKCVLFEKSSLLNATLAENNLTLHPDIEVLDPEKIAEKYITPMVNLRKNKGLTEKEAKEQLKDSVVIGTMMMQLGEADGLVSGALHTTANTIRPALQLIKTKPDCSLVSSAFFICLPEQVLVFSDCAFNIKPTAEELADIAIQSSDSAAQFGITPRVAMISYSTGDSGHGEDVDKIKQATLIACKKRPDLFIDGPLQYDAALIPEVAKLKRPASSVAGKATVFIFPDLNTGNTVSKAVQRTANVNTVGPLSQGLNKPVNDLSRGCTTEDIVYTIALTSVQASFNDK